MGRGGGGSAGEADVQQGPQNKNKRALYWAFMWIPMGTDGKDSPEGDHKPWLWPEARELQILIRN